MCALHRELIVPTDDLDRIAVTCGRCHSVTVVELGLRIKDELGREMLPALTHCAVCSRDFDPRLKQVLRDLAAMLSYLGSLRDGDEVSFRVRPPEQSNE